MATETATPESKRWLALDALRGLSLIGMLLNLNPGAWEYTYGWLTHAKWEGIVLIDMVAPVFLFCVGASLPLSLHRRMAAGDSRKDIWLHILWRALALMVLGVLLNAYPLFDWGTVRIPGVLQRIGLTYGIVGTFVVWTARRDDGGLAIRPRLLLAAMAFILLSYWVLLTYVPVPGFGAPRFDPIGNWPAYIDRSLFGVAHMFPHWPVDGKVVFDPDGLLSAYPVCATVISGVLIGHLYRQGQFSWSRMFIVGLISMALALLLQGPSPIIKNIWTPTFVLFSSGVAISSLALLTAAYRYAAVKTALFPAVVYGSNATAAYLICWFLMPVMDINWAQPNEPYMSIRSSSQLLLRPFLDNYAASLAFGLVYLGGIYLILWGLYRKRWFLKL